MKFFKNEEISKKGLAVRLVCLVLAILMLLAACGEDTATATKKKKKKVVVVKKPASSDVEDTSSENTADDDFNYEEEEEEEEEKPAEEQKEEEEDEGEDLKKEPIIDRSFRESTVPAKYSKLVWHDEFDGTVLNADNWSNAQWSWVTEQYKYLSTDTQFQNVKDGTLNRFGRLWFDPYNVDIKFAQAPGLHTTDLMRWRYGYIECCARMPYKPTTWSALWTQSDTFDSDLDRDYMIEIDIIEVFGSYDTFVPNVHKWYTDAATERGIIPMPETGRPHTQDSYRVPHTFEHPENLYNEFHVYGFEWTPELFAWYVDGEKAYEYDFTRTDGYSNMSSFARAGDYMWYIIGDGLITKATSGDMSYNGGAPYSEYPAETQIDWIRLYQDPNEAASGFLTADTIPEDRKKNIH